MIELIWAILNIVLLLLITIGVYCLPSIIAINNKHKNLAVIIILNIALGWTLIVWAIVLIWAILHKNEK